MHQAQGNEKTAKTLNGNYYHPKVSNKFPQQSNATTNSNAITNTNSIAITNTSSNSSSNTSKQNSQNLHLRQTLPQSLQASNTSKQNFPNLHLHQSLQSPNNLLNSSNLQFSNNLLNSSIQNLPLNSRLTPYSIQSVANPASGRDSAIPDENNDSDAASSAIGRGSTSQEKKGRILSYLGNTSTQNADGFFQNSQNSQNSQIPQFVDDDDVDVDVNEDEERAKLKQAVDNIMSYSSKTSQKNMTKNEIPSFNEIAKEEELNDFGSQHPKPENNEVVVRYEEDSRLNFGPEDDTLSDSSDEFLHTQQVETPKKNSSKRTPQKKKNSSKQKKKNSKKYESSDYDEEDDEDEKPQRRHQNRNSARGKKSVQREPSSSRNQVVDPDAERVKRAKQNNRFIELYVMGKEQQHYDSLHSQNENTSSSDDTIKIVDDSHLNGTPTRAVFQLSQKKLGNINHHFFKFNTYFRSKKKMAIKERSQKSICCS